MSINTLDRINEGLIKMSSISQDIKMFLSLKTLSSLLGVSKKQLRRAIEILKTPKIKVSVKTTLLEFNYGFRSFRISKNKGGKKRLISMPHPCLQIVYRAINNWLSGISEISVSHPNAYGFVRGRNHIMAVKYLFKQWLLGKTHCFSFDIADAFPSISQEMIKDALMRLRLIDEMLAETLSWLTTQRDHDGRRVLPQGASSSPSLLNLVYQPMCEEIANVCKKHKIHWIVYADDFSFIGKKIPPAVKDELMRIPQKYGFEIKNEKIRDNQGRNIPHFLGLTIPLINGIPSIHIEKKRKKEYRLLFHLAIYGKILPKKISGIVEAIKGVYGEEENWPGWLLKPWREFKRRCMKDG